jgi:F0F1-type ATP synthase delta subunit
MTKKIIKKLALSSYSGKKLDSIKVNKIVKLLNRSELKIYIKTLKNYENMRTVTIVTPILTGKDNLIKDIKSMFAGKKILLKQDKTLIAGVRIIDNDTIYDFNVQNNLENLVSYISQ